MLTSSTEKFRKKLLFRFRIDYSEIFHNFAPLFIQNSGAMIYNTLNNRFLNFYALCWGYLENWKSTASLY